MKQLKYLCLIICGGLIVSGCSTSSVISPDLQPDSSAVSQNHTDRNPRVLWGMWNISIDPESLIATAVPSRDVQTHLNVTKMVLPPACVDCLDLKVNSFNPGTKVLDVDVTLYNSYKVSGFDVRGILFTDNSGRTVNNADDWAGLYDIEGGLSINPFRAFAKSVPQRKFASKMSYKENYLIYMPAWDNIVFAVDASWPGNCSEPYAIDNFIQDSIKSDTGSTGTIYVDVHDWQEDVEWVRISIPAVNGSDLDPMYHVGGNTWAFDLINSNGADAGHYLARFTASSINSTGELDGIVPVTISAGTGFNPVEVTKPWLIYEPGLAYVDASIFYFVGDNYMYPDNKGLYMMDVSDPENPIWIGFVQLPEMWKSNVVVQNGYAYIPCGKSGMQVIDVDPPQSAHIALSLDTGFYAESVDVDGDIAVVSENGTGLVLVDISQPESAHIIKTIFGGWGEVYIDNGYAIYADWDVVNIVDIDPPESAHLVKSVTTEDSAGFYMDNGYAFVAGSSGGLDIVDIDPPETASLVKHVSTPEDPYDVTVRDGYAYLPASWDEFYIVDVEPADSASIVKTTTMDPEGYGITLVGDYAYVSNEDKYFDIYSMVPPDTVQYLKTIPKMEFPQNIEITGNHACVADGNSLLFMDIGNPEFAGISSGYIIPDMMWGYVADFAIINNIAYAACLDDGFMILDLTDVSNPSLLGTLPVTGNALAVDASGDYAYVCVDTSNLLVVDISPPETPTVVNTIPLPEIPAGVVISGFYAYVLDGTSGIQVVDIEPPGSASIVHTIDTPGDANDAVIDSNYLYVADGYTGLQVADISDPPTAGIISTATSTGEAMKLEVQGDYAFIADGPAGLSVIDISDPESPLFMHSIWSDWYGYDVGVSGNYAYLADGVGGVKVYKLW